MAFQTTRWSLVTRATRDDDQGVHALDELCATYWPPVYALFRGEGLAAEDARDLTQGLFAELLARGDFGRADPERGRFRTFLRACARNYLANERSRARALKRGGGRTVISIDVDREESRLRLEPADSMTPAALFERRWAETVIETALERLRIAEDAAGRGPLFEILRPALEGLPPPRPWAELATAFSTTEGALKVAAHRLKARFRERLTAEVRDTVDDPESVGAEFEQLLSSLG